MYKRPMIYIFVAICLGILPQEPATAEKRATSPNQKSAAITVVRKRPMVISRAALPPGVLAGTLGSTMFGYVQETSIPGSLERQAAAGQLLHLRAWNGKIYWGNRELNGTLPLLDQISYLRWEQMGNVPQVEGPMSVLNTSKGSTPKIYSSRTYVWNGVPMQTSGANVTEHGRSTSSRAGRKDVIRQLQVAAGKSPTRAPDTHM